jgi:hypothetical protein
LDYLKSIGLFPTIPPTEEFFSGQFLSSIILSHIDIENEMNLFTKQSKLSSFSCEFHPTTFKYLFNIIEQLTTTSESNNTITHILNICLRLSATHFQLLSDIKSDNHHITDDELKSWFELLFKLISNQDLSISKEASKALIKVIKTS